MEHETSEPAQQDSIACPLCRGAGFVTYRDGIPYETHDVEREEHLIEDCPECKR